MRRTKVTLALSSLDANGICVDQTTAAAADLLLNGALVETDIEAHLGVAAAVRLTCAGDESGRIFTIKGRDSLGRPVTAILAGVSATTTDTTQTFKHVTEVRVDGATAGNVEVGTAADDNGICTSQTLTAACALTLNGAAVKIGMLRGAAKLEVPAVVKIASVGNDTGVTFTVYGRTADGVEASEDITGVSAATATGTILMAVVNRVAADGATAAAATVGIAGKLDGICLSQTMAGSGDLVFNGELCELFARHLTIEGSGDNSGITFTIEGINRQLKEISEVVTGGNATTVVSAKNFLKVWSIRASDAVTGNVEIGSGDSFDSLPIIVDNIAGGMSVFIDRSSDASLTHNFKFTHDSLLDGSRDEDSARWFTSNGDQVVDEIISSFGAITALRVEVTNFVSGSIDLAVIPPRAI